MIEKCLKLPPGCDITDVNLSGLLEGYSMEEAIKVIIQNLIYKLLITVFLGRSIIHGELF